jgi:hypothetical protein
VSRGSVEVEEHGGLAGGEGAQLDAAKVVGRDSEALRALDGDPGEDVLGDGG